MSKKVYIFHGWDGYPEEGWFPWLKQQLESRGFEIFVPQLPQADEPRIKNWLPALSEFVKNPNQDTYFVGHSMGCQAIVRYLENLPKDTKIGGAIFVAGFLKSLAGLEDDDTVRDVAKEWLDTPIDFEKVKKHLEKSVAIFSDDDPWVPLENQNDFREKLGAKIIIEHKQGHFSGQRDNTKELPIVLQELLKITE
ncbi:MAG: alpha/beta hydrolase [Patescibacteria group bacterium]|jgi:hypothetical protein